MAQPLSQAETLAEQIAVKQIADDDFVSVTSPGRMGNSKPIAYGGCTTAVAVHAACQTVKAGFNLYSVMGYFLGPSLIDRPVRCKVFRTRDTKTFATRRVVLTQNLDNGTQRSCLELFADFQMAEPASAMLFQPRTIRNYPSPAQTPSTVQLRDQFVSQSKITEKQGALLDDMFRLNALFFDQKAIPDGVTGQNMMGFGKHLPTDQDHLHITEKFSAEWLKAKGDLPTNGEQLAALAFNMDGGLSFIPLIHDHAFLEDAGACSSLDFALRIFTDKLDLTQWHVKERKAIAGEGGRTYSEARLFDADGNLVAIESQQSIMRPVPGRPTSKL
jgi:acyl-CoA thioesterase II